MGAIKKLARNAPRRIIKELRAQCRNSPTCQRIDVPSLEMKETWFREISERFGWDEPPPKIVLIEKEYNRLGDDFSLARSPIEIRYFTFYASADEISIHKNRN